MTRRAPHYERRLPFDLGTAQPDPLAAVLEVLDAAQTRSEFDHALDALRGLAGSGSADAAGILGRVLWTIDSGAQEGIDWLRVATDAGDVEATHLLGLAYFCGRGVEQEHAQARRLQTEAAKRGLPDAQFELSLLLALGIGGKRDARAAALWERKAAEAGHPRACLNRGSRLASARRPNFAEAARWYERAAEAGNAEAAARLCRMHLAGQGVARDEAMARQWFDRAAELGWDWSEEQLA